mgnify:CR=1 FL=1
MNTRQYLIFRGYTSTENLTAGAPLIKTDRIPNTERAIRKAIKDHGLDDSRRFPHVTTQSVRG